MWAYAGKAFHELSVNTKHKYCQTALLSSCLKGWENVFAMTSAPSYRQQQCGLGGWEPWDSWKEGSSWYSHKTVDHDKLPGISSALANDVPKQQVELNNQTSCQNCCRIKLRLLLNIVLLKEIENKINSGPQLGHSWSTYWCHWSGHQYEVCRTFPLER